MNRALILIAALLLWTVAAFVAGWQVRDGSAEASVATVETQQQTARAEHAEGARVADHANARTGAGAQQQRADKAAASESEFKIIERRVVEYVYANPDPAVCELDGDGMRAWREANAGTVFGSEPGHTGGPVDAEGGRPAATGER